MAEQGIMHQTTLVHSCNSVTVMKKKERRKKGVCVCVSVCSVCDYCHVPSSADLVSIIYTKPVVSPECGQCM